METFREYIFSVISVAILCAVISNFLQDTKAKDLIKILGGLVLVLTVIKPIVRIDIESLLQWKDSYFEDASYYRDLGQREASQAISKRIKEETEAYIQSEAEKMNAQINIEVFVDETHNPQKVYISGEISPSSRQKLVRLLEDSLAITKENQIWTG